MTNKITIPDEHYIGMRRYKSDLPLAFITPNGTDKAALKRIQTVNSWSKGRGEIDPIIVNNKPLYGFKLTGHVKQSSQYGSGDKWYVEDPRGFQLEINSSNLAYLIHNSTIENGSILDSCLWARRGSNNVLLATSTELYKTAVALTSLTKVNVPIKHVEPGNTVMLQNSIKGMYVGKYHLLQHSLRSNDVFTWYTPQHVIVEYDYDNNFKNIHVYANPKVSYISDKTTLNIKDAEKYLNEIISTKQSVISTWWPMLAATTKKPVSVSINLVLENDIQAAFNSDEDNQYVVELISGDVGLYSSLNDYEIKLLDISNISAGHMPYIHQNTNSRYDKRYQSFLPKNVKAVYKIEVVIKTRLGNDIVTRP